MEKVVYYLYIYPKTVTSEKTIEHLIRNDSSKDHMRLLFISDYDIFSSSESFHVNKNSKTVGICTGFIKKIKIQ